MSTVRCLTACAGSYLRGPVECFRQMYSSGGLRRCYRAFNVMVLRDIPASIIYFITYELTHHRLMQMMNQITRLNDNRNRIGEVVSSLAAGGTAGVISWSLVFPIDLVKSRLQADFDCRRYSAGWRQCVADISREWSRGETTDYVSRLKRLKVFYVGMTPCLLRAFPVNAVTFAVHCEMLKLLGGDCPTNWS